MTAVLGTVLLTVCGTSALAGAVTAAVGSAMAHRLVVTAAGSAAAATLLMIGALLAPDFTVAHVAAHGSRALPVRDRVTALWAGADGSLLLWVLVLAAVTALAAHQVRRSDVLTGRAVVPMAVVVAVFALLIVFVSNPFAAVSPAPSDGPGPNPLLRDHPAMSVHPPLLYLGYACLLPPAAMALVAGRRGWVPSAVPWVRASSTLLGAAILLGAWWSYSVLGWGGYWAWDPVENVALLPWLTGAAFLHLARRGAFARAASGPLHTLALMSFLLVVLGVTLTRSGAVLSVHAFSESTAGPILLGVLVCALVAVALAVLTTRASWDLVRPTTAAGAVTAAAASLMILLAGAVLVGTVLPVVVEALIGERTQVGAPYFDAAAVPFGLAVLALLCVAPVARGPLSMRPVLQRVVPMVSAGAAVAATAGTVGALSLTTSVTLGLCAGAVVASLWPVRSRHRLRRLGVATAHLGFATLVAGVVVSSGAATSTQVTLVQGDDVATGGRSFVFEGLETAGDESSITTTVVLRDDQGRLLRPRLRFDTDQDVLVSQPDSATGLGATMQALLVSVDSRAGTVQVQLRRDPMLVWGWTGGALVVLGAGLAGLRGPAAAAGRARRRVDATSTGVDDVDEVAGSGTRRAGVGRAP